MVVVVGCVWVGGGVGVWCGKWMGVVVVDGGGGGVVVVVVAVVGVVEGSVKLSDEPPSPTLILCR